MRFIQTKITKSIFTIIAITIITFIVFYCIKPPYILEINKKGEKKVYYPILICLSFLIGFLGGVIVFIFMDKNNIDGNPININHQKSEKSNRFINYYN